MPFGMHEFLSRPFVYITLLRNPVDRILSMYHYVMRTPNHYLHKQGRISRASTLKDFVSGKVTNEINNGQTRMISGITNIPFGKCDHTLLEKARDNIDKYFAVVGLVEEFDPSLLLMKRTLGWKTPYYTKRNVTKDISRVQGISDDTLNLIGEYNQLDMELYQYAKERLQKEVDDLGSPFIRNVRLFQFGNLCTMYYNRITPSVRRRTTMAKGCR